MSRGTMDLPVQLSVALLLLGYLGWLICKDQRPGIFSAQGPERGGVSIPVTFDSFLHNQQLRKKLLRAYCHQRSKVNRVLRPSHLSRLRVNERLRLVYCCVPDVGPANWELMLKALSELPEPVQNVVNENALLPAPDQNLGHYDMGTVGALLASYTKILFVRHPLQRLLSAYRHQRQGAETFEGFVLRTLSQMSLPAAQREPLVKLCQPCLIRYDYIVAPEHLNQEVRHLLRRMGVPEGVETPELQEPDDGLMSQGYTHQLPTHGAAKLFRFYRGDFAAFNFTEPWSLS